MLFSRKQKGSIPKEHPEKALYGHLGTLAGAYLMLDYDIFGDTPSEVLEYYVKTAGPHHSARLREDIRRFLDAKSRLSDEDFAEQYSEILFPGESLEGWNGKTTRQWLQEFYASLAPL